ncbi:MAG: hypothetical protein WCO60_20220 [Verrucomicrobiota bacterium]
MPYTVIVGNVGALPYDTLEEAQAVFNEYLHHSQANIGRASGQDVTLLSPDDEILAEHSGEDDEPEEIDVDQVIQELAKIMKIVDEEDSNPTPAKFSTGQIRITQGAKSSFGLSDLFDALRRHVRGDWGCVCDEDKELNDASLLNGTRVISAYMIGDDKLWIITEADRSLTTLLLPEEY